MTSPKWNNKQPFIVMYHGAITNGRGIEEMLQAQARTNDIYSVVLGNGDKTYLNYLEEYAERLGIRKRVLFHEAVSIEELKDYLGSVDVGMIVSPPITKSYYFGLPNKFFENIQAETPVIVSELPEMVNLVEQFGLGLVADTKNIDIIVESICRLRDNKELYSSIKTNLIRAKQVLNWENEKNVLKNAFAKYIN